MSVPKTIRVIRADDQLVFEVSHEGLTVVPGPGPGEFGLARTVAGSGTVTVSLPPQHMVEYATPAQPTPPVNPPLVHVPQDKPIFPSPAVAVFAVSKTDGAIPLTVTGILAALGRLTMLTDGANGALEAVTAQRAGVGLTAREARTSAALTFGAATARIEARGVAVEQPGGNSSAPTASSVVPPAKLTRFPLPYRLTIRPPAGTALIHAVLPVQHTNRFEPWTTRLGVRRADGSSVEVPTQVVFDAPADAAPVEGPLVESAILNSLTAARSRTIARSSLNPDSGARVPADLQRLRMSTFGGWLDVSGSWLDLPEFRHSTAMGRDQSQRIVETGILYPFGHAAVLAADSSRQFEHLLTRGASLATTSVVTVRQRRQTFPVTKTRAFPWDLIDIVTRVSPTGDAVQALKNSAIPVGMEGVQILRVRGVPFRYACEAVDRAGGLTRFELPLLFVPTAIASDPSLADTLRQLWEAQDKSSFASIDLAGQALALAPVSGDATGPVGLAATSSLPPDATTVLAKRVALSLGAGGLPKVSQVVGRIPTLDKFGVPDLPGAVDDLAMSYAQTYIDNGFAAANAQGQLWLQTAKAKVLGMAGEATGGLAELAMPISALSREFGALAAKVSQSGVIDPKVLAKLAAGELDLSFLDALDMLLGIVPLKDLIPTTPKLTLAKNQKITTKVVDGVAISTVMVDVPLFGEKKFITAGVAALLPGTGKPGEKPNLHIEQRTEVGPDKTVHSRTECVIRLVELRLYAKTNPDPDKNPALVSIPFKSLTFVIKDGEKPDIDIDLGRVRFGGLLGFVSTLADFIDSGGFHDPPALELTENGVKSSYSFAVPAVALGMFMLENISFTTSVALDFKEKPALLFAASFGTSTNPFRLTVSALGGGGYLEIGVSTDGLEFVAGSLEFGAALAIDLIVARASVEAMGGVAFRYSAAAGLVISGYFRIRGELNVLSLITVAVTLTLTLTYAEQTNRFVGEAEIVVEISLLFFTQTVKVPFKREFAGPNADPTFAELLAPADTTGPLPWDLYCAAFAAAPTNAAPMNAAPVGA